jgi:hypothetical protein
MSEIHRLRDETKSPFARLLLESVDEDRPAPGARGRAMSALGLSAVGAVTATVTAETAKAAAALTGSAVSPAIAAHAASVAPAAIKVSIVLKSLGVVVLGGAAAYTGVHLVATSDESKPAPITDVAVSGPVRALAPPDKAGTPAPSAVDTAVPVEDAASAEAIPPPPPRPGLRARSGAAAAPSARRAAALQEQTDMLDQARAALALGNASGAMATLDDLGRRHANGPLAEEATVLRIEALLAAGNREAGEALAQRFLEQHPSSAYAQRVRSRLRQAARKQ